MKPSKRKQLAGTELGRLVEQVEYAKLRPKGQKCHENQCFSLRNNLQCGK
jgi:hypothetical protein